MLKKRRLRPLEDWKLAKQRRNCQQVHQQCFDCVYNSAGGFYTGRTLVKGRPVCFGLLTFGTLRLVGRQLHGHKCCYVNHVALLHWDSITISCFIQASGCYAAFYGAAVLVEMSFFRDCNFLCVRLHTV